MINTNFGICLNRLSNGVVIVPTARADLHMDRLAYELQHADMVRGLVGKGALRPLMQPRLLALITCPTAISAAKLSAVLNQFWKGHGRVVEGDVVISEQDAVRTVDLCSVAWGLKPRVPAGDATAHKRTHRHDVIAFDDVPDPSMSPAEYWHRLAQGDRVEQFSTVVAPINLTTLLGGLAMIPERQEIHEQAAKTYKTLYDRVVLMGNPRAIDYGSAVQVDNSRSLSPFLGGLDGTSDRYKQAVRALGQLRSSVVDPIILHENSVAAVARRRFGTSGGQARKRIKTELLEGLDILGVHFQLAGSSAAQSKVTGWYETRLPLDIPAA